MQQVSPLEAAIFFFFFQRKYKHQFNFLTVSSQELPEKVEENFEIS